MSDAPVPTTQRRSFKGIHATAFQHPLDRQATEKLKKIKGFDWLVRKFVEYGIERIEYVTNIGGAIRVGPRQMPKYYEMLRAACSVLDVGEPELYVMNGGTNAYTTGHDHPVIVLQSGLLGLMDDDEVLAVVGHELGHIKCGHVLYKSMARGIAPFFEVLGAATLGIAELVGSGIEASLLAWDRRSKLSADRAALLVTQDVRPCMTMLMKLAGAPKEMEGVDLEQFLNQARAYKEGLDQRMSDRFYRFIVGVSATHPFAVERARALDEWVATDEYRSILAGNYSTAAALATTGKICPTCGWVGKITDMFCLRDGTPLPMR